MPLLFLSGLSWPLSNIPSYWQGVSWVFPSTFGVRAYVKLNSMGATLDDITLEYSILWLHAIIYFLLACLVYRYQIKRAEQDAHERLVMMREKKSQMKKATAD